MDSYLIRLQCESPYLTPWRSCTLWGRLAWIIADGRLPSWDIDRWIACYRTGEPPLIIGDGFPANAIPVPAIHLAHSSGAQKKPKTLPWPHWLSLCETGTWPEQTFDSSQTKVERTHVVMERESGRSLDGGLRTESGVLPPEGLVILAKVNASLGESGLRALINELCTEGWGQGRTYGYGHIALDQIEKLKLPTNQSHVVTLGHCHPTADLPDTGFWRITGVPVRRHDPQSRKGPIQEFTAMLLPGASFPGNAPYIGTHVEEASRPNYVHYGLTPTWPVKCHSPES